MCPVSVVVPTYDRADMVGDAIRSVLRQTYEDWELIVVDDGSTDETRQVVGAFSDPRIRYAFQQNKGLPGARNTGIRMASGEYIAFLDSDDLFLPHKLELQVSAMESQSGLGLIAGGYVEVDAQLNAIRETRPWESCPTLDLKTWVLRCPVTPHAVLVRRDWLDRADLFDEEMRYVEDWDLWLRLSKLGCPMDWVKEPVCYYRIHGGNMMRNAKRMKDGMVTMLDKLYAQPSLPADVIALRDKAYARMYFSGAAKAYAAGGIVEGRAWLGKAVELDPELAQGSPPPMLASMASFALGPASGEPDLFMDRLIRNLPGGVGFPPWSRRKARGLLKAVAAFDCYQRQKHQGVVKNALLSLFLDPSWFRNRGLLSIAVRAFAQLLTSPHQVLCPQHLQRDAIVSQRARDAHTAGADTVEQGERVG